MLGTPPRGRPDAYHRRRRSAGGGRRPADDEDPNDVRTRENPELPSALRPRDRSPESNRSLSRAQRLRKDEPARGPVPPVRDPTAGSRLESDSGAVGRVGHTGHWLEAAVRRFRWESDHRHRRATRSVRPDETAPRYRSTQDDGVLSGRFRACLATWSLELDEPPVLLRDGIRKEDREPHSHGRGWIRNRAGPRSADDPRRAGLAPNRQPSGRPRAPRATAARGADGPRRGCAADRRTQAPRDRGRFGERGGRRFGPTSGFPS